MHSWLIRRRIPIGIGLGLPSLYVLCAAISIEAGIFLGIYGIIDTFGQTSKRVAGFLEKTKTIAGRSKMFDRYGILGLFPCEILIGVYVCAPVSRLFGWQKSRAFAITMAGLLRRCHNDDPCHPRPDPIFSSLKTE